MFTGGVANYIGAAAIAAWLGVTVFLWDSNEAKAVEVGKLNVEMVRVLDTNKGLTELAKREKLERTRVEALLEELTLARTVIAVKETKNIEVVLNEKSDECLDTVIPDGIIDSLRIN